MNPIILTCLSLLTASAICLTAGTANAAVVTLLPVDDAFLSSSGAAADQPWDTPIMEQFGYSGGTKRPLLKFNLSSIPDNVTLTSARLTMQETGVYGGEEYFTALSRMPNDDWLEETVTWNSYDQTGAVLVAILPFDNAGTRMWSISLASWNYAQDLADNSVTFLVRWYVDIHGGTETNDVLKSVSYSSKEGTNPPTLEIEYSTNAPAPPLMDIARPGNTIVVSWPVSAGDWSLECTNSLNSLSVPWSLVPPPYQTNGDTISVTFTNTPAAGNRFFRLHKP